MRLLALLRTLPSPERTAERLPIRSEDPREPLNDERLELLRDMLELLRLGLLLYDERLGLLLNDERLELEPPLNDERLELLLDERLMLEELLWLPPPPLRPPPPR